MHTLPMLALFGFAGGSAFDDMLRLIGIAAIIWALFKGIRSLMVKPAAAPPVTPPVAPAPQVPAPAAASQAARETAPAEDAIAPELVAAIAAAVFSVTCGKHRIISIKKIDTTWEKAGRQSVLSSHKIR